MIQANSNRIQPHPMEYDNKFEAEDEVYQKKLPYDKCLTAYDLLKFIGAFLFLSDLMLKIAYYRNSRFNSEQVYELYWLFLIARPVMITGYMLINFFMQVQWLCVYHCKNRKEQKS